MDAEDLKEWERSIPNKIELNLDDGIRKLKEMKSELPYFLGRLSSREYTILCKMMAIIEGLDVPLRLESEETT